MRLESKGVSLGTVKIPGFKNCRISRKSSVPLTKRVLQKKAPVNYQTNEGTFELDPMPYHGLLLYCICVK